LLRKLGWDDFVASHPEGTVFQSPDMYELYDKTSRMKPVLVGIAEQGTGKLAGILLGVIIRELNGPTGYFSARTVVYGGPLIDPAAENREEILDLLLNGLINKVKNQAIFIQFRNFNCMEDNKAVFLENGFHLRDRLNLLVDTSSIESVKKSMSGSRYRQVKKGFSQGAEIIEPENIGQVRELYDILFDLYRHKVKKPLPSRDFFENFYILSKEGRLGIIRLVRYEGRIIGGIVSPVSPGRTIYEWYVCGLDQEYRTVYPSVLATWAAIDYAIKNNIPCFDFMGVGLPDRKYGVREFKMRFGGETVNYGRYARINNKAVYAVSEIAYNLLAYMKRI
jgi:hypothetical protein